MGSIQRIRTWVTPLSRLHLIRPGLRRATFPSRGRLWLVQHNGSPCRGAVAAKAVTEGCTPPSRLSAAHLPYKGRRHGRGCGKIRNIHRFIHSFHRLFHSPSLTLPPQNSAEFMILSHFRNLPAWIRGRKRIGLSIFIHQETGKGTLARPAFTGLPPE